MQRDELPETWPRAVGQVKPPHSNVCCGAGNARIRFQGGHHRKGDARYGPCPSIVASVTLVKIAALIAALTSESLPLLQGQRAQRVRTIVATAEDVRDASRLRRDTVIVVPRWFQPTAIDDEVRGRMRYALRRDHAKIGAGGSRWICSGSDC